MAASDPDLSSRAVDADRLRRLFQVFGGTHGRDRSLVYEVLSAGIVRDDALLCLLLEAPGEQRRPSLLFAAVNLLLAARPDADLAAYYPIHGGRREVDGQLVPAFAAFCDEHRDELVALLRTRSTQTNEIRRCVALRLGLDYVSRRWPGPVALVEPGASAGLNLLFDQYSYRTDGRSIPGGETSPVVVSCDTQSTSDVRPFDASPTITSRLGFDQHPIDLSDPDARAWLEAFIWPEQVAELATLRAAINLALSTPGPRTVTADATTSTAQLIRDLPGDEPVVVFTASLLSYLTSDRRSAFLAQLDEAARCRRVAWVFAETPGLLALAGLNIPALRGPLARRNTLYAIGTSVRTPDTDDDLLALADPYLRWLAIAHAANDDFTWLATP